MAGYNNNNNPKPGAIQNELDIIKHHVNFEPPSHPGQEWRSYPELPTSDDLNPDWDDPEQMAKIRHLLPNTWKEPWRSKNTYLETHYRLQREEAITMLRYSIRKFKDDPAMMDDEETCVYTRVFVRGYLMTRLGPMCQVQFSTKRSGKKIRWTQTRRLTVGSLVALSTAADCFKTICMPAIISDHSIRDGLDQNPPTIHFQWANNNDAVMDPNQELVMIESRFGYFEAVRHSMVGIQHVADTETRLDKYLVHADKSDISAEYVEENPHMDIRSLVHHIPNSSSMTGMEAEAEWTRVREPLRNHPMLNGFDSRLSDYTNLDNSQLSAVHRILTKEMAIVQGPPGTGKTFTSVQALQILINSRERGSNVIIVSAQTNHAVDQILNQLIKVNINVVRLGGRTQNEEIKRYSMYNLRRAARMTHRGADTDFKNSENARRANIKALESVVEDVFPDDLMDPVKLRLAGIISETQLASLQADQSWVTAPSSPDRPTGLLADWLGGQLVKVELHDDKDPDFDVVEDVDDLDLDGEDYDLELDDCIVDEDENAGRIDGKFIPIKHLWSGANPKSHSENDAVIRRELQKSDLWDIDVKYRGAVYQYWQKKLLSKHHQVFRNLLAVNTKTTKNLKINRWYKDTLCIKSSRIEVIGCTTTGLCKYRGLLAALQPRTMLIEEAAETREANILSALYGSLQQLILVGDHQQLAPHCDTPGLGEEPYCLRISMFERLVHLQMPFTVLNTQRRMIPSLREILNPFYPELRDHPVVTRPDARPPIPGMTVPSFFFHHTWVDAVDENLSRFNVLEAEMIVRFMDYLLMNGVPASQITVLTFYRGQKKRILHECKTKLRQWAPFANVFTVDSYQGEENDIVILSLVRSSGPNGPHKAGFLQDQNRGVVSISRARRGFYIFGNMINLAYASTASWNMWGRVRQVFERQGRLGENTRLPITCQNHGKTTWMSHPEDWVNCHGGCDMKCQDKLSCGHACGRQCHWVTHDKLICREPCERILPCNHRCQQVCGEKCVCTCASFTGAYAHDEFPSDDATLGTGIDYDSTRVAPFITAEQRRAVAAVGGRDSRQDIGRGDRGRGYRRGFGYDGGSRGDARQNVDESDFVRPGDYHSYRWAVFDAHQDDKRKLREVQEQTQLVQASVPLLNGTTQAIRDTFRSVTLNEHGRRNIGEEVESREITTPSPKEDKDLLSFDDSAEMAALTTCPVSVAAMSPYPAGFNFSPHQQPQPSPQVPLTAPVTVSRQVEGAEWELASLADTASADGDDKEVGDLISF
ncbi:P-loop containing nucleoside triphosphate hydrolase protein [Hypoxylon cercidicola]|nr:P-loop containing nucleoside triphosphate hydrolase protein [Hypoxylon cercidicola]